MTTIPSKKVKIPPLRINDCRLIWRNFAGSQKRYNAEGLRNFHVVVDDLTAAMLLKDGWNVKSHKGREEGEPDWWTLKVSVRFDNYPPSIVIKNGTVRTQFDEPMLDVLDWAELSNVKLMINGSAYTTPTNSGIKAYLSRMIADISEADFAFSGLDGLPTSTPIGTNEA